MVKMTKDLGTYVGIADCYGIESFVKKGNVDEGILMIRAMANRHRHSVLYRATLNKKDVETIKKLLKKEEFERALLHLKKSAVKIEIAKGMEHSFRLIPNPELDPYYR